MNEGELRIHAHASEQYGLISRRQALTEMSERQIDNRIATGRWSVVHPSVYRIIGAPITTRQRLLAATLWIGDACVVSHLAAARLLRLDAIPLPKSIDVSAGHPIGKRAQGITTHHCRIDRIDRTTVDGIPCTSATRTVIDLAQLLSDEALETAFESARRMGLSSLPALARRAAALCGRGRAGSSQVRHLLATIESRPVESRLEVKTARLLRAHGLRPPANQFVVGPYRLDFAWPLLLLAIECDGFEHHGRRLVWKRDRRRIAALESQGWRIVHVTWEDITNRPDETVARIQLALARAA